MLLQNVNIIGREGPVNIKLERNRIHSISAGTEAGKDELDIVFDEAIAFPGLINSHDHLEFNLFPKLGNTTYNSYLEWGADIFAKNRDVINMVTKVPKHLRAEWGVFKNILNGVTTVVHHGEYFNINSPVINVFQDCYSLHSVKLEKNWKFKLNRFFPVHQPFVIHIGEGTDSASLDETNELIKWNLFKRQLIAIHGISMTEEQAKSFHALIWCPDSNYFLYNATAAIDTIKRQTKILFGTDSCVSAGWNLWDHIRLARGTKMLTDEELFNSLTSLPAAVWGLEGKGILAEGKEADIVIAKTRVGKNLFDCFFQLNPADILLVVCGGEIVFFDEEIYPSLKYHIPVKNFNKIHIDVTSKYVKGNLNGLVAEIKKEAPEIKFPLEFD